MRILGLQLAGMLLAGMLLAGILLAGISVTGCDFGRIPVDETLAEDSGWAPDDTENNENNENTDSAPPPATILEERIQAECADGTMVGDCNGTYSGTNSGGITGSGGTVVGYFGHGDYLSYNQVDLTGYNTLTLRRANELSGGSFEVRLDSRSGQLLASVYSASTGGYNSWTESNISFDATGTHTVYIVANHSANVEQELGNLDWLELSAGGGDGASDADADNYPPLASGASAGTTRYWDCCKPTCAWQRPMNMCSVSNTPISWNADEASGCDYGSAFTCFNYAPFAVNDFLSYGFVAFNNASSNCGDCYQLDFQGTLAGKRMVVQATNTGDGGLDSFDLMIPGGGVGENVAGCQQQWGSDKDLGVTYGGFSSSCNNDPTCIESMCEAAFGQHADLMDGCRWYLGWFQHADNPSVIYQKVACPAAISAISGM